MFYGRTVGGGMLRVNASYLFFGIFVRLKGICSVGGYLFEGKIFVFEDNGRIFDLWDFCFMGR
jgi:hypothetical protein